MDIGFYILFSPYEDKGIEITGLYLNNYMIRQRMGEILINTIFALNCLATPILF